MSTLWRDGDRTRTVEIAPLGGSRWRVTVDGSELEIEAEILAAGRLKIVAGGDAHAVRVTAAGERRFVRLDALDFVLQREKEGGRRAAGGGAADHGLEAPMPGVVTRVMVEPGAVVKKGQPLVALEAMKMEHLIRAPRDGRVASVAARSGEMVAGGAALVEMAEDSGPGDASQHP